MPTKAELKEENDRLYRKIYDLEIEKYDQRDYLTGYILQYQAILDKYGIEDQVCKKRGLHVLGLCRENE